jgi:copper chaperone CopZ
MTRIVLAAGLLVLAGTWTSAALAVDAEVAGPDDAAVAAAVKALKVAPGETLVFVEDLHCATCAKKVTSTLFKQKGVKRVRTSVKFDAAVVTPQAQKPLNTVAAWEALQKAGYQPTRLVGPDGVFIADGDEKAPLKIAESPTVTR